jgi:hypothetical protein
VVQACVNDDPAVAIAQQIDIDVIERNRHRDARPEQAIGNALQGAARLGRVNGVEQRGAGARAFCAAGRGSGGGVFLHDAPFFFLCRELMRPILGRMRAKNIPQMQQGRILRDFDGLLTVLSRKTCLSSY